MLTSDENLVDLNVAVQYRRADPVAYVFNVRDPESTLGQVSESAIREIIGRSELDFVLEQGRQEISAKTKELVQRTLDVYKTGIVVTTVNLQGVNVPEQVQNAQRDAIKAREDRERLALEAQAYANDILPKAKGSAARQSEDAIAYKARLTADARRRSAALHAAARGVRASTCRHATTPLLRNARRSARQYQQSARRHQAGQRQHDLPAARQARRRPHAHAHARRTAPGARHGSAARRGLGDGRAVRSTVESRRERGSR